MKSWAPPCSGLCITGFRQLPICPQLCDDPAAFRRTRVKRLAEMVQREWTVLPTRDLSTQKGLRNRRFLIFPHLAVRNIQLQSPLPDSCQLVPMIMFFPEHRNISQCEAGTPPIAVILVNLSPSLFELIRQHGFDGRMAQHCSMFPTPRCNHSHLMGSGVPVGHPQERITALLPMRRKLTPMQTSSR